MNYHISNCDCLRRKTIGDCVGTKKDLPDGYKIHHYSISRGYVSRKAKDGYLFQYKGRWGEGFALLTPNNHSTAYCDVAYYVKEVQ